MNHKILDKIYVVRRTTSRSSEEEAISRVIQAEKELIDGKGFKGDLRKYI